MAHNPARWPSASVPNSPAHREIGSHMEIGEKRGAADATVSRGLPLALRALLSVLVWALPLPAQDGMNLTGRVREAGGKVVVGAKVTFVNEKTQAKQETATAEDGTFAFAQVSPGNYRFQVEAAGFEPYETSIPVGAEELPPLKVQLKLRAVEEEVTVRPDTSDDRISPES